MGVDWLKTHQEVLPFISQFDITMELKGKIRPQHYHDFRSTTGGGTHRKRIESFNLSNESKSVTHLTLALNDKRNITSVRFLEYSFDFTKLGVPVGVEHYFSRRQNYMNFAKRDYSRETKEMH